MTMQTTSLPFQVNTSAPQRSSANADRLADGVRDSGGGASFGATLSRELAARQQAPQPTAPAPAAQGAKPIQQQPSKPAAADKPANREPVRENGARTNAKPAAHEGEKTAQAAGDAGKAAKATDEAGEAGADDAAAAGAPATDMLAFMASLAQPANAAATVAADAAAGAGQAQLTALENALQNMRGAALGAGAATTDDSAATGAAAGDAGLGLATGVQQSPTDLRAAQAAQGDVLQQGQDQQDGAGFQARLQEAQQQPPAAADDAAPPLAQLQAQAARLDAAQGPTGVPADRIPARVGTQAWDNQVSQRIVYMVGKEQAATLTLNPPDLGPVQIVLNVSNDQASVAFSSQQLEVRQALENALPRLREMMSESGIALGNATVDAGTPNSQQQAQEGGERRANGGHGAGNLAADGRETEPAVNEVAPRTRTVAVGDRGTVDLFA